MVVLGSTGSIGVNTLDIAKTNDIAVEALSCKKNYKLLNEQIEKFKPKFVHIGDKSLKSFVKHDRVFTDDSGILDMLDECKSELVVNALVGFAGLAPSLKIQKINKTLALANKESLVVGGKFLDCKAIRAIDSEHFGLNFLLSGQKTPVKSLVITASGGAFYKTPLKELKTATPAMALKHPNWDMGAKITIDSATMTNKLFEILEAFWLYGIKEIDAVVEQTSMIHALVNFIDGSTTAHICNTDMRLAIAHAVLGDVKKEILPSVDLLSLAKIEFKKIDLEKFPIFSLKDKVLKNPNLGVIINASNEIGVEAFLAGKCGFLDISKVVFKSLEKFENLELKEPDELFYYDNLVREFAKNELKLNLKDRNVI
ncbi:1-deoxy-D-xylulose-5-phosphate reductoisomerase [Campylobacter geochelonis]|uniref:1-deoxy-D-xylulose 5-phosphate reductoisomerase n=1 Tax=Campylobacter geochelonis TaxID=1780362 RepID=A0A128ECI4_9BACT|nr:1-deoxy-D-xylulose-5-phosphate reductoisomerase [Campylobacter geochelonis]QKF72114.1 1-deoxy-D-xylulose 5-phosphate reductoisomerase [Campylobacter geochelonis]CZE46706.1 1-deoxy-D-xylulose 5-phosphate reductoisomerase [Campylobacter geochelonis]